MNLPLPLEAACVDGVTAAAPCLFLPPVEDLHPSLWRAHQLGRQRGDVAATGFDALDLALPGGGWPHRGLTELLLARPGLGEMRLLAPALAARSQADGGGRCVMLFDPPALPCAWALAQLGLPVRQLLLVRGRPANRLQHHSPNADLLWALEQSLKSGQAGAVLAWLPPRLSANALRRLQLAAQGHDGPAFMLREPDARRRPSAAPLRLQLEAGASIDTLVVQVIKRRGPPLAEPITLALPPVLTEHQRERAEMKPPRSLRSLPPEGASAADRQSRIRAEP